MVIIHDSIFFLQSIIYNLFKVTYKLLCKQQKLKRVVTMSIQLTHWLCCVRVLRVVTGSCGWEDTAILQQPILSWRSTMTYPIQWMFFRNSLSFAYKPMFFIRFNPLTDFWLKGKLVQIISITKRRVGRVVWMAWCRATRTMLRKYSF